MAGPVTKPKWFRCLLGTGAHHYLAQHGQSPDIFSLMLAASGGPRWVGLVGIDRALRTFLKGRTVKTPLPVLGASSGAWRMAAISSDDNGNTYEHLLKEYVEQRYTGSPTPQEVSDVCRGYIGRVFHLERVRHALANSRFQLNFTTAMMKSERPSKTRTLLSLGLALTLNMVSRDRLRHCYRRGLFSVLPHPLDSPLDRGWDGLPTAQIELNELNFQQGLMASGSIPLVLEGESPVPGSPPGHHLDGGLLDYHFELSGNKAPVLYPHFSDDPIPGWLDRFPPKRKIGSGAKKHLCIIMPSRELLAEYPTGDFPNRHDFRRFSNDQRIKLWYKTAELHEKLERELTACLESGELLEVSEPLI